MTDVTDGLIVPAQQTDRWGKSWKLLRFMLLCIFGLLFCQRQRTTHRGNFKHSGLIAGIVVHKQYQQVSDAIQRELRET